jgi:D-glycero-D-manno-heptose 1,7-bisphosphate phosphatase
MRSAVFLDRDGVIIENKMDYVKSWDEVHFLPGVFVALSRLAKSEFAIVMVTNQSAIGRGIITAEDAEKLNEQILVVIKTNGGRIDGWYLCPHRPEDDCTCRKPRPGLLLRAAKEMGLDLRNSYLIGDAASDMEAAQAAGVKGVLVLTGLSKPESKTNKEVPYLTVSDLNAAVDKILTKPGKEK